VGWAGCGGDEPVRAPADPEAARVVTDAITAGALGLHLAPTSISARGDQPPQIDDAVAPSLAELGCLVVSPDPDGAPRKMVLPPGGAVIMAAPKAPAEARLRRLARRSYPIAIGRVGAGREALLRIPTDGSSRRWQIAVESEEMISVCGAKPRAGA
jgi:hypothetical protein